MKKFLFFLWVLCVVNLVFGYAHAEPEKTKWAPDTSSKPRIDVGVGYWHTNASLNLNLFADQDWDGGLSAKKGDKVSRLKNDLDAGMLVVNAEAYLFWRLYADAFVGWGDFDGEHEDSDWLPRYRPDLMQFSKSDADGSVSTWNANMYFRLLEEPENRGYLDIGGGYFYYQDNIKHIKNTTITTMDWTQVSIPLPGHDSSDKYTFDGFRFAAKSRIVLHDRIAVKLSGGINPWLNVKNDKFWNLRDDLGQPPGLKIKGDAKGTAFDLNIGVEAKLFEHLFLEAGYKYISMESGKGDLDWNWIATPGIDMVTKDNWDVDAHRGGFYLMGRLKI